MRTRVLAAVVVPLVLLLTACDPPAPGPSPSGPDASPTESTSPDPIVLPENAVLALTAVATTADGATADVTVIVHAPVAFDSEDAEVARATTLAWCSGEVDADVLAAQDVRFTVVDVAVEPRTGDWPADPLLVFPSPDSSAGSTLAVSPGLRQVEALEGGGEGEYVPHCLQPAVLDGAGGGTAYLGVAGSGTGWTLHDYGVSATLPGDLGASTIVFSECQATVTELGEQFGALQAGWEERFEDGLCVVGGAP